MAITNAQQYKQLLAKGGRIGLKGGADASMADFGTPSTPGVSKGRKGPGPNVSAGGASFNDLGPSPSGDDYDRNRQVSLETLKEEGVPEINAPGLLGLGLNATKKLRDFSLKKNIDYFQDLNTTKYPKTAEGYKQYMQDRLSGEIDAAGNTVMTRDGDNNFIPVDTTFDMASSDMDQGTEMEDDTMLKRRFAAEGGIMNSDVVGGEMDFDSARQMYGLGKLVKKITKSVKKVAKSPIGKAALLYTGLGGLGNLASGASFFSNFASPTTFLSGSSLGNIFTKQGLGNIASRFGLGSMVSEKTAGDAVIKKFSPNFFGKILTSPTGLMTAASTVAGLLTPEQEAEAQKISDETGIDIDTIRANPNQYLARRFRAEGGSMKEPVAKKTMPLLDMDGQEMDLRAEGGFVPIGRMEKADDVPARLSKNEFVFTADAVRNAGEGDVDKGAEVMYNMMKNLESGGDVSEESQGLEGARQMFQTSQRLEEVI